MENAQDIFPNSVPGMLVAFFTLIFGAIGAYLLVIKKLLAKDDTVSKENTPEKPPDEG